MKNLDSEKNLGSEVIDRHLLLPDAVYVIRWYGATIKKALNFQEYELFREKKLNIPLPD